MRADSTPQLDDLHADSQWLRSLVRRMAANDGDVDDVMQDVLVAAWRSPPTDEVRRPWLARVARNAFRMRLRGERRRAARDERAVLAPSQELSPRELVELDELHSSLTRGVLELDEPFRSVILLRYWRGHTSSEIADQLGIAPGTVRWRLKEGVARLRAAIDPAPTRVCRAGFVPAAFGPVAPAQISSPAAYAGWLGKAVITMKLSKLGIAVAAGILAIVGGAVWLTLHVNDDGAPPPMAAPLAAHAVAAVPPRSIAEPDHPLAVAAPAAAPPSAETMARGAPSQRAASPPPESDQRTRKAEFLAQLKHDWASEPVDPSWGPRMSARIRDRMARYANLALPDNAVECRSRCCTIQISRTTFDDVQQDLMSSVVIGDLGLADVIRPARAGGTEGHICFDRDRDDDGWDVPDRGAERARLLAKAAPGLAACTAQDETELSLSMVLQLDASGAISEVRSNAEQSGTMAARCAEQVILSLVDFAPAPIATRVPIRVTLAAKARADAKR